MCSLSAGSSLPHSGHRYVAGLRFCARRIALPARLESPGHRSRACHHGRSGRYGARAWSTRPAHHHRDRPPPDHRRPVAAGDGYRSRLTDYLNAAEREFLALTDVEVTNLEGTPRVEKREFIALSLRHVVLAMPAEDAESVRARGPPARIGFPDGQPRRRRPQRPQPQRRRCAPRRACSTRPAGQALPGAPGGAADPVRPGDHRPAGGGLRPRGGRADRGVAAVRLPVLDAHRVLAAPDRLPLRARGRASAPGCTGSSTASTTTTRTTRCGS